MKIKDLRRLESEIDDELAYINFGVRGHNQFTSQLAAANAGEEALNASLQKLRALNEVKFDIREAVRIFNEYKGINKRTLIIAQLEAELKVLSQVQSMGAPSYCESYGSGKSYWRAGIESKLVDEARAQSRRVRREVQSLKDSCNGINSSGDASLSDKSMDILRKYGMID